METPRKRNHMAWSWQILLGTIGLLIVAMLVVLFVLSRGLQWTGHTMVQQQKTIQHLGQELQEAHRSIARLTAEMNTFSQTWQTDKKTLAWREAYQWAQMGYQQAVVIQDPVRAMPLFQFADAKLARENQPQWQKLREAIAMDIAALQKRTAFDKNGVMAKWHILKQQLSRLPLREQTQSMSFPTTARIREEKSPHAFAWRESLTRSLEILQKMVIIRRHDKPISPLLPEQEIQYLRQHLALLCDQAIFAIMQSNAEIYAQSASDLSELLNLYFDRQLPPVSAALMQIDQLRGLEISFDSSNVSHALEAFREMGGG